MVVGYGHSRNFYLGQKGKKKYEAVLIGDFFFYIRRTQKCAYHFPHILPEDTWLHSQQSAQEIKETALVLYPVKKKEQVSRW